MCFCLGLFMGNKCCGQSQSNCSNKCCEGGQKTIGQNYFKVICKCKAFRQNSSNNCQNREIYQPAHCPLICPKNFNNYQPDFWENGFNY